MYLGDQRNNRSSYEHQIGSDLFSIVVIRNYYPQFLQLNCYRLNIFFYFDFLFIYISM